MSLRPKKATRGTKPRQSGKAKRRNGLVSKAELVPLSALRPSPENDLLYRPVDPQDPEIAELARSIHKQGLLEPLVITADAYILSGHRRYAAAKLARLKTIPCRRLPIRRDEDPDGFLRLLREHNRQRDKTSAEKLREELVILNPDDAHQELFQYRRAQAAVHAKPLAIRGRTLRKRITAAKRPLLLAIQAIVESRRDFWPLSDRQIHYALLNDPPLKHASKPGSVYKNDQVSYKALVDLLTRARLEGLIPFEAVEDETRPVQIWDVHPNPRSFVQRELNDMFRGYWRDLLQSQPNHIELIGEKNTVASILRPIAAEYTIPLTTGRGYCSLPPRCAMAQRFTRSGKDKLILLLVSDFDPDGEEIAHSFARSMRDDFAVDTLHPIKVALTGNQIKRFQLPPKLTAKVTSSRYKKFVRRHGKHVHELEALPPETLQEIVRAAIESVMDRTAFTREIEAEREDAAFLLGVRRTVEKSLSGIDLESGNDD